SCECETWVPCFQKPDICFHSHALLNSFGPAGAVLEARGGGGGG
ncbi:hypothetical protein Z043-124453, partial [Arapaima gigas]